MRREYSNLTIDDTSFRLIVSQGGRALHLVNDNQFLDSPEWFGVTTDEYFQVTVTALESSKILVWHRDLVKFCLMEEPSLQAIFDHVVGRDVVRKLMQVNNCLRTSCVSSHSLFECFKLLLIGKPLNILKPISFKTVHFILARL